MSPLEWPYVLDFSYAATLLAVGVIAAILLWFDHKRG